MTISRLLSPKRIRGPRLLRRIQVPGWPSVTTNGTNGGLRTLGGFKTCFRPTGNTQYMDCEPLNVCRLARGTRIHTVMGINIGNTRRESTSYESGTSTPTSPGVLSLRRGTGRTTKIRTSGRLWRRRTLLQTRRTYLRRRFGRLCHTGRS